MSTPDIGMVRNLDDCIRAINLLRAYFNTPAPVTPAAMTTAQVTALADKTYTDVGGTGKTAKIQLRWLGTNPDGTDIWTVEGYTV